MQCPIHGCQEKAPPRGILCAPHWCLVPERAKVAVRERFDPSKLLEEQGQTYWDAAASAVQLARKADEMVRAVPQLKALTLWRPWAWLIAAGHKPVENRTWAPPRALLGQRIVLHAGKTMDRDGAVAVRQEFGIEFPPEAWAEGIVGVATLVRSFDGITTALEPMRSSPWYSGDIGWVFAEPIQIPAVECKGAQGLWDVPAEVARKAWYRRAVEIAKKS